ncbi:CYTH domain-containing protein [Bacillus sp. AGMB 02131]|uniref:CYTH domain-containing protein n=1 Tax=Peribacillus faecalis TaxID=2772559 RepID=A0A927D024_9BACI|nr:CYTH domain-containing protein [Peribacillus faecalis]MBD3110171.1 CYTH domain-containing protein [Peribacillus faecalis]
MHQEIEIEFKNLLTKTEFDKLCDSFSLKESDFILQENHYFDSENFSLKNKGCALRIRKKKNSYEMTLKQPAEEGLLETNETLSEDEAKAIIASNRIPEGQIAKIIREELEVEPESVIYFGSLRTHRAETEYEGGLLVIDHSMYLNKEDYELEYEVSDFSAGQKIFLELLKTLNIPVRQTDNKIKRFYTAKYK